MQVTVRIWINQIKDEGGNIIMKMSIKLLTIMSLVFTMLIVLTGCEEKKKENDNYKIVTSFYPIYIMTSNITKTANSVELSNMADVNAGCLHDYTLQPTDLKKIEKADIFIENGLGIESFNDKLINSFENLEIVNSTDKITEIIQDQDEINGHTWTSIDNYIKQVEEIKEKLKEKNPANSEIYEKNAQEYIEKLLELKERYDMELADLKGKKAVLLNESFDYLLKSLEIETIDLHTDHEESTISAENLKEIIDEMKENDINIIIIDKDDNEKNAQMIQNETGAKIYKLNSCLKGELDNSSYIKAMNENLEVLKEIE